VSSGPVGLDVKEYAYGYFKYQPPDGNGHSLAAGKDWLITKIQFYAGAADDAHIAIGSRVSNQLTVLAGGCLILEPNGAHRGDIFLDGDGSLLIVEYWFQANAEGSINIVVDGVP
jgi:hypothetical protein